MSKTITGVKDFKTVLADKIESENAAKAATIALSDELCEMLDINQYTLAMMESMSISIRLPDLKVHLEVKSSAAFNWRPTIIVREYFPNMTSELGLGVIAEVEKELAKEKWNDQTH